MKAAMLTLAFSLTACSHAVSAPSVDFFRARSAPEGPASIAGTPNL